MATLSREQQDLLLKIRKHESEFMKLTNVERGYPFGVALKNRIELLRKRSNELKEK
jgi:hypothetical protein